MEPKRRWAVAFAAALAVAGLNYYLCRDLFWVESTAQMHSMHGFWTALARLGEFHWMTPQWWPYWDGGMPAEYTYAPLIPSATAAVSAVFAVPELRALQIVLGAILVAGPALLFLALWRLTAALGWSFVAAVSYALLAPDSFLAPRVGFSFENLLDPHRYYVVAVWDEGPHMAALALWPLAALSLFRMIETRRWTWLAVGVLAMAAMVYASAFGATLLALTAICVLGAIGFTPANMALVAVAGALTYLTACTALPPSYVKVIREASNFHNHGWTWKSWTTLALVGVAWSIVQPWLRRRVDDSRLRFFSLFALTSLLIVWLYLTAGRQFVPQPERYKMELAVGVTLAAVFALRRVWPRLSRPLAWALALLALAVATEQTVSVRRWAKESIQQRDVAPTIEYRVAQAVQRLIPPGDRVMLTGSFEKWLNAFSAKTQFRGGSWSTAPNLAQQWASNDIVTEQGDIQRSLVWFRAFGVSVVEVEGPESPTQWKTFADPKKYEGHLDRLWFEDDTALYRVPLRTTSQAHALPEGSQTTRDPATVQPYVAALEDERLPGLTVSWDGSNRANIRGFVQAGEGVLAHINHHPGWRARLAGAEIPLEADGLGQMWMRPGCDGDCMIELEYVGSLEWYACRVLSLTTGAAMLALLWWGRRGRRMPF